MSSLDLGVSLFKQFMKPHATQAWMLKLNLWVTDPRYYSISVDNLENNPYCSFYINPNEFCL